ncbi:hypothetical protein PVAP13_6KG151018 [Panicum virgatum]|uniref:Uncharacterized protein n=1 Tax=Panicum virgatum TaxID=38727 RepID=A0A8T0RCU0_PANVG|nr:hypothetical protein PVAP13_6KG151018 [Panicum virgatum]
MARWAWRPGAPPHLAGAEQGPRPWQRASRALASSSPSGGAGVASGAALTYSSSSYARGHGAMVRRPLLACSPAVRSLASHSLLHPWRARAPSIPARGDDAAAGSAPAHAGSGGSAGSPFLPAPRAAGWPSGGGEQVAPAPWPCSHAGQRPSPPSIWSGGVAERRRRRRVGGPCSLALLAKLRTAGLGGGGEIWAAASRADRGARACAQAGSRGCVRAEPAAGRAEQGGPAPFSPSGGLLRRQWPRAT